MRRYRIECGRCGRFFEGYIESPLVREDKVFLPHLPQDSKNSYIATVTGNSENSLRKDIMDERKSFAVYPGQSKDVV